MNENVNAKPYLFQQFKALEVERIQSLLSNYDAHKNAHDERIHNPKGGQGFLYFTSDKNKAKDYKVDGYNWRCMSGTKPTPPSHPLIFRSYFNVAISTNKNSDKFQKIVYHLYDAANKQPIELPVFIHYLGTTDLDELKSYLPQVHGNTKDKDSANRFQRTLPSVYSQLESQLINQKPSEVYKKASKNEGPRNTQQCKNIRKVIIQIK